MSPTPAPPVPSAPRPEAVDPVEGLFASASVAEHLLRGMVGLVLAVLALAFAGDHPWALLGLVGAVVAWRGCPTCWALGLGATRRRGCVDGTCH